MAYRDAFKLNRPKCLKLDYTIVACNLIAVNGLSQQKHDRIKQQAEKNVDRMDELMGYLDDHATKDAFNAFIAAAEECGEDGLAKKLHGDAEGKRTSMTSGDCPVLYNNAIPGNYQVAEAGNPNTKLGEIEQQSSSSASIANGSKKPSPNLKRPFQVEPPPIQYIEGPNTAMTFGVVRDKIRENSADFTFSVCRAQVKSIDTPREGVTYKGCSKSFPGRLCAKKLDIVSMGDQNCTYKCPQHGPIGSIPIPLLKVTFSDDTGDLEVTLFQNNVEVFLDSTAFDLSGLETTQLQALLDSKIHKCWTLPEITVKKNQNYWNIVANSIYPFQGIPGAPKMGRTSL